MPQQNSHGQPVGPTVENWSPRPLPGRHPLIGRTCRVEPVDVGRHAGDLFAAYHTAPDDRDWTYLPLTRPESQTDCATYLAETAASSDPLRFVGIVRFGDQELERVQPDALPVGRWARSM